jgi:hypothetical protein
MILSWLYDSFPSSVDNGLEHGGLENLLAAVIYLSFLSLLASQLALIVTHSRIKLGIYSKILKTI